MMYFLATLITVFSVVTIATTALPSSDSEESDPASFSSLDLPLPFPDSLPLGAATADNEPNLSAANLDQSLNFLAPSTFGSPIAQLPGANSAEISSTINPSTTDTTAQTHTDDAIDMCSADGSTSQKIQKRQDWCPRASYFLLRPESPPINYAHRTVAQSENDEKSRVDKEWWDIIFGKTLPERQLTDKLFLLWDPGRKRCSRRAPKFTTPLCCLGPPEFVTVPTLGLRKVRRQQSVTIMNVHNCLLFLVGRPFCTSEEQRFCCNSVTIGYGDWGFTGLDCAAMIWVNYPLGNPWWHIWPFGS